MPADLAGSPSAPSVELPGGRRQLGETYRDEVEYLDDLAGPPFEPGDYVSDERR